MGLRHAEWIAEHLDRPGLTALESADIDALDALLQEHHVLAGTTVFRVGDAPSRVGIIRRGSLELSQTLNNRRVALRILGPGDVMGDVGVFLRMAAPCDGIALEDTVILTVESVRFHRLLQERPRIALRWLIAASNGLAQYDARLVQLLAHSLEARLASVLLHHADRELVKLRQDSLAELVGAGRTSINRVLKRLEEHQLIRAGYGHLELIDEAGLADIAGLPRPDPRINARAGRAARTG